MWKKYAQAAEIADDKINKAFMARDREINKGTAQDAPFFVQNNKDIDSYCKTAAENYCQAIETIPLKEPDAAERIAEMSRYLSSVLDTRAGFAKELLEEKEQARDELIKNNDLSETGKNRIAALNKEIKSARVKVYETDLFKTQMKSRVNDRLSKSQIDVNLDFELKGTSRNICEQEFSRSVDRIEEIIKARTTARRNGKAMSPEYILNTNKQLNKFLTVLDENYQKGELRKQLPAVEKRQGILSKVYAELKRDVKDMELARADGAPEFTLTMARASLDQFRKEYPATSRNMEEKDAKMAVAQEGPAQMRPKGKDRGMSLA